MKTDAPIKASTLRMRTDLSAAESARQKVSDSKRNSASKQSTPRPDMILGQTVSVQNPTTKRWDKRGIIVEAQDARNRTFQLKIDGTVWTHSELFLRPVHHIPLKDPSLASKGEAGPSRSHCDLAYFPFLPPPLPAPCRSARVQQRKKWETGTVNAVFTSPPPPPPEEEKKEQPPPAREEKNKIRQPGLPRSVSISMPTCQIRQVQAAAALMGLPNRYNDQFVFFRKKDNSNNREIMIVTIPSLIAAVIATALVTGGITGTAVYLMSGDADIITGDQFKTEGRLHILKLDHPGPWLIAMISVTILLGMGTCGACCHKQGQKYVTDKEAKLRDRALGRAKELVHMGAHGSDKLLQDVQMYHDMHHEIVKMKMHQITPPRNGGKYWEKPCENPAMLRVPQAKALSSRIQQQQPGGHRAKMTNFCQWNRLTGYRRLIVYVVKCQMSQILTKSYKYNLRQ
jgi:hypothetical protein